MTVNFGSGLLCAVVCALAPSAAFPQAADKSPLVDRSRPHPEGLCSADAECVMTDFSGCCGKCCPTPPRAMLRTRLTREQQRCAAVDCEAMSCAMVVCELVPSASAFEARCRGGACVAQPRAEVRPVECRTDRDCTISYHEPGPGDACRSSVCGCCPDQNPQAVPVSRAEVERRRPARPDPKVVPQTGQGFGLSEGHTGPDRPSCSPCPAPKPARAVCEQRRCVLAPAVPLPR